MEREEVNADENMSKLVLKPMTFIYDYYICTNLGESLARISILRWVDLCSLLVISLTSASSFIVHPL